jgi:hypothetical protein
VIQIGLSLADLDFLSYGQVMDMFVEAGNDDCQYDQLASQADMDRF